MTSKELTNAAMKLSPMQRARLAARLLDSLADDPDLRAEALWAVEAEDRIDAVDSGRMKAKRLSEVLRRLQHRGAKPGL
jgi:putative addiction module component (TIGR02574 family)